MNLMSKRSLAIVAAGLSLVSVAAEKPEKPTSRPKIPFRELIDRQQGGFIVDTRAQKGRLVVVNAQKAVDAEAVASSTKALVKDLRISVVHQTGTFDLKSSARIGEATVYVISDETLPSVLVAADDRWGFVNVAKLRADKEEFFRSRVQKAIVRVAGLVLGAGDSGQFPLCLTGHISGPEQLDQVPKAQLPMDVVQRIVRSMPNIGITQYKNTTYRKACEQGWAPQPTNEYQKAIWEKVHQLPTEPLKIKPETKKVAE